MKPAQLAELARVGRLKADLELKRLSALNQHMIAGRQRIADVTDAIDLARQDRAPASVEQARLANLQAANRARDLIAAQTELARLTPQYEAARQVAAREYGRYLALDQLRQHSKAQQDRPRYD